MIPFRGVPFTLVSPYSPEECAERLGKVMTPEPGFLRILAALNTERLAGVVTTTYVRVQRLHAYQNFMQPELTATLEPYGSGTRLDCRIALPLPNLALLSLASAFLVLIALAVLVGIARGNADLAKVWPTFFVGAFFCGLIVLGRFLARGEREALETTLIEVLGARKEG